MLNAKTSEERVKLSLVKEALTVHGAQAVDQAYMALCSFKFTDEAEKAVVQVAPAVNCRSVTCHTGFPWVRS